MSGAKPAAERALAEGRPATERSSYQTEGGRAEDRTCSPLSDKGFDGCTLALSSA